MVHRQLRAGHVVHVHARHAPPLDAVAHPHDVEVPLREIVERLVAALDVSHDDDPVGVRLLEHRAVHRRNVGPVVDMAEEEPVVPLRGLRH